MLFINMGNSETVNMPRSKSKFNVHNISLVIDKLTKLIAVGYTGQKLTYNITLEKTTHKA